MIIRNKNFVMRIFMCMNMILCASLSAQTYNSVSLESRVYGILEQAELRGLCSPLPGVRPYTRSLIIEKINEITNSVNAGKLSGGERIILNQYLDKFSKPKAGMNWQRGSFFGETGIGRNNAPLTINVGITADIDGSTGLYSGGLYSKGANSKANYYGMEFWPGIYLDGDLGRNISYGFTFEGGLIRAPIRQLGEYYTYFKGFNAEGNIGYQNPQIDVYSEPLTYFPYTYKKRWDSSVFYFSNLSGYANWPDDFAGGYSLPAEVTASFLENKLVLRLGRISHDWGSGPLGSSLAFNSMARPLLAIEGQFDPVSWFSAASLTGILEYYNINGLKDSAMTFQNAFSISMLQFRYKNYLFFDFTDAVVWPKRLELGYVSPITSNFFYQNNTGDFDNMALSFNLKAQYPGLGSIWFSLFIDEIDLTSNLFTQDRQMFAAQTGINLPLPFLSFSSIKISYTKINPYCYTHPRTLTPWYGSSLMETAYINNGTGLGYYLPPNSDEILVRFDTMPVPDLSVNVQYSLIRHGADFGPDAVDGSNLSSELFYGGIGIYPEYNRYFLRDGAYQWDHVIKAGAEWNLPGIPVTLSCEAGILVSYFTDIGGLANSGKPSAYSKINTSEYPKTNGFIAQIGVTIFPRW